MKRTKTLYLSLGSNLGNRHKQLLNATIFISDKIGIIDIKSNVYETTPWGKTEQPAFLNQVLKVETMFFPHTILESLKVYELDNGRTEKGNWKARTIDIDILFYEQITIDEKNLSIPHPLIPKRKFVLIPLCEIAPLYNHSFFKFTMHELLKQCEDTKQVQLWNPNDEVSIHNY